MSENIYVVEWASDEWGEYHDWKGLEFRTLDHAKEWAMDKCLAGFAVRMYVK